MIGTYGASIGKWGRSPLFPPTAQEITIPASGAITITSEYVALHGAGGLDDEVTSISIGAGMAGKLICLARGTGIITVNKSEINSSGNVTLNHDNDQFYCRCTAVDTLVGMSNWSMGA